MGILLDIVKFITQQILGVPALLVGIVALIGLIVQKKKFHEILAGAFRTTIGFMIIGVGAGALVGVLLPMSDMFQKGLNLTGAYPFNENIVAIALPLYGALVVYVMAAGFVVNLILARFTKWKYVYLTGHIMLFTATIITVMFKLWSPLPDGLIVIVGGLIAGFFNTVLPAICQPYMTQVTGGQPLAYGHSSNVVAFLGGWLGSKFGDPSKNANDIKLPKYLMFFRDTTVGTAVTMMLFYLGIVIIVGPTLASEYSGSTNPWVWIVMQGLMFGGGVTVLLTGVRMLIGEIVIAFKGISDRLVPNALPALDCPVVMPYAPNAWLIGFTVSYVLGLIFTVILGATKLFPVLVIASVIPHFFDSGPAAVFGNATGGVRGAIIAAVVSSFIVTFGISLLIPITGPGLADSGTSWCCSDYGTIYMGLGYLLKLVFGR
jgi:PTS system ascorbate-specific IIC component